MAFDREKSARQIAGYLKLTRAHYRAAGGNNLSPSPALELSQQLAIEMSAEVLLLACDIKDLLTPYNGEEL